MSKAFVHTRLDAIKSMRNQDMTWREIAAATEFYGTPEALSQSFYKVAKEMGLQDKKPLIDEKYTEKDVRSWAAMNLSFSQIHNLTGLHFDAAKRLYARHGLEMVNMKNKKNRAVSRDEMRRLEKEGLTHREIALKLNCSKSAVTNGLSSGNENYRPNDTIPPSMQVPKEVRSIVMGPWRN